MLQCHAHQALTTMTWELNLKMIAIFVLQTLIMQMKLSLDADHVANLPLLLKELMHVLVSEIIVLIAQ